MNGKGKRSLFNLYIRKYLILCIYRIVHVHLQKCNIPFKNKKNRQKGRIKALLEKRIETGHFLGQ